MDNKQKEILNKIHEKATDDDHLLVPFSRDQLVMAKSVIEKLESKLARIADLAKAINYYEQVGE